ncbi:glycosyltransferase family 4 protein [Moorena producens JHB]|uniref:Glycosyltransferase family 4 protein n=1 Tax=Moorena producens (strain JHB) TaxID=1454205 RepID=A0A1D9FUN8_MOOP1|nr:glycosyltransferase family 4 protein [Moorena producens]AOY79096.1 glycosyltransferase family 4 protein [Moorena producens JHB]
MKIFHVGCSASPQAVDGVNNTVWSVANEQTSLGHQVTLIVDTKPDEFAIAFAAKNGVKIIHIPANTWGYESRLISNMLDSKPPQIVHMHSVFLPKQATLARKLVRKKIPYVITPNAMSPQLLQRGRVKKSLYSWLIEKPRFSQASGISVVTPKEEKAVRAFVPPYKGRIRWVPNPVNPKQLGTHSWRGNLNQKRLVYLGRFDILHKGIDILVEIARFLPPEIEVHLYGTKDAKTNKWMERLQRNLPSNVYFHDPVFGEQKAKVLSEASLYIQTSRWEVFGISIAEAMYLGVPCAVADTVNLAELFDKHDLGLVLPSNPKKAASCLTELLAQPTQLHHWSKRAQSYAQAHFQPKEVALGYLQLYKEVLGV